MFDPVPGEERLTWRGAPRYFVALLAALQLRNADFEPMRRLDHSEWLDLLSFADPAHLILLLAQLPSDVLPRWVASRIQENVSDNTQRVGQIRTAYLELAEAFRRVNADHLVIKGFTQYPGYVRSLNLRMQSDIDIFCPPNTILAARDAVLALGYQQARYQRHVQADHFPSMTRPGKWQWRGNSFDPEMSPSVELHYCLWNEQAARLSLSEVEQFWYRRITREIQGFSFPALNPVDHVAFCSLHILRGVLLGDWIVHHVYELAYFLSAHARDHKFWSNWRESHSSRLRSLESLSFCLAKMWFACDVHEEVDTSIHSLAPPIRQWMRLFRSSSLETMFAPNHNGVWLHVALVESLRDKAAVLRGLLPARIPPLGIADLTPTVNRQADLRPRSRLRAVRYGLYVAGRAGYYARIAFRGVLSGARWWLSQRKVGAVLWSFLAPL